MASNRSEITHGKSMDSAFSFSLSIGVGLILFIGGLVISLTFGSENPIGLIFGIPLIVAGLIVPLIMMRGIFTQNEITTVCPYCSAPLKISDATLQLDCPACGRPVGVKDMKARALEQ